MARTRFAAVALLLAVALGLWVAPVAAQPKGPAAGWGQPLPLKGIGKAPENTPQHATGLWGDRLVADLEQLKADVAVAKLAAPARRGLVERADAVIDRVTVLEKALVQNNRNQWYRAFADVEGAIGELAKA